MGYIIISLSPVRSGLSSLDGHHKGAVLRYAKIASLLSISKTKYIENDITPGKMMHKSFRKPDLRKGSAKMVELMGIQ